MYPEKTENCCKARTEQAFCAPMPVFVNSAPAFSMPQPDGSYYMQAYVSNCAPQPEPESEKEAQPVSHAPLKKRKRGMIKYILLGIITLGIYPLVCLSHISQEINTIAEKNDGKITMFYCLALFLSVFTCGLSLILWESRLCGRIGRELNRRNIDYKFNEGSYWGWNVFGSLILVGPFIYLHKFFKAMGKLVDSYNSEI